MSRGRKPTLMNLGNSWQSIFTKNYGAYFKVLLKELGKISTTGSESTEDLYNRLRAEGGFDIKQFQPIKPDEIPFKIPLNWKWCRLNEIGISTIGIIFKPSQVGKTGIPVLRANNIQNNKIVYEDLIYVDTTVRDKQIAKVGDILICVRSGSNSLIGKSAIIEKDGMSFGAFMSLFRSSINPYVHSFMTSDLFKSQIDDKKSTGINQLTQNTLNNILIPLPPISEQENISKFFKAFESERFVPEGHYFDIEIEKKIFDLHKSQLKMAIIKCELTHQLTQLTHLNQAILQEAVQGKLVPQDPNDEPASELLKRIKAEKEKSGKKEKPLPPIKPEEIPFEIPSTWVWCRLGEITDLITSGSRDWAQYHSDQGAIFVRMGNLSKNSFDLRMDKIQFINPPQSQEGNRTRLIENDILISITGEVGNLGLIPKDFGEAYINQHTALVRLNNQNLFRYIAFTFLSKFLKDQFNAPQRGMKNSFRLTDVEFLIIPLPPLSEQKRIVAEIERQMTKTKQLKEHVLANQQATEQLLKALLHQAFEGEAA